MNSIHTLRRLAGAALVLALLFVPSIASAQTALTTTTLSAIVTNPSDQSIQVTSATSITAPGTGATFVYILADKELMGVRAVNGTVISVSRGQNGTRATSHANGIVVTVVPPTAIVNYVPSGQCVRTNLIAVPVVVGGSDEQSFNGATFDCLGVTTAGQYAQTNSNGVPVLGSTMASTAGTLGLFTGTYLKVSGTNAITGFTNPAGIQPGFTIYLEATGIWTWTAAGNILTAGTTTAAGRVFLFIWNGAKWAPVQIA